MKRTSFITGAGMLLALAICGARAESWPAKPVRIIVPAGAGSTVDIVGRLVSEQLATQLGQSFVIENRAGAGTTIGESLVAKSDPDGYTLLVNSSAHTIVPSLYSNIGYNTSRDFIAVAPLGVSSSVLVVSAASSYTSVADLVAAARARPAALTFSSVGIGTATHLSAERFRTSAGIAVTHIPLKGGAEALTEVLARRVDFFFGPVGLVLPHIRDGKLRPLVVNGAKRVASLPDVPTTLDAGFANAEYPFWIGIFAPSKTPKHIIERLNAEAMKGLRTPKLREAMANLAFEPVAMTPAEFEAHVQQEIVADAALVKSIGIRVD